MPGSNFLLFYLMATNLSTEETGEERGRRGEKARYKREHEVSYFWIILIERDV